MGDTTNRKLCVHPHAACYRVSVHDNVITGIFFLSAYDQYAQKLVYCVLYEMTYNISSDIQKPNNGFEKMSISGPTSRSGLRISNKKLCRVFYIISLMIINPWNQSQNSQIFMVTGTFMEMISFVHCFLFMNLMITKTRKNVSSDVYITLDSRLKPWTRCPTLISNSQSFWN